LKKRLFDIVFSAFVLIFFSPLFLLLALLAKLSTGSPLFSQERVGKGGKPFRCYKFRTMVKEADKQLIELLKNPEIKEEWEKTQKLKNDPRITNFGFFLRKTSLDELPQFWNVLKGDLSVVGPRPVLPEEVSKHFKEKAPKILSIKPGLTGIWQTSGRNRLDYKKRVKLDYFYVEKQNFALDLKLILKTIPKMVMNNDAY
jgi:undecaprenyl-phosphate galactose phosphotransferase